MKPWWLDNYSLYMLYILALVGACVILSAIKKEIAFQWERFRLTEEQKTPSSREYIGHNEAHRLGVAKCFCHKSRIECPFHGR